MAICVLGAGTNLPEPRLPMDPVARGGVLAGPRPYQTDHQMMADNAPVAIIEALRQAKTSHEEINLIITMGVSPSHVADSPEIVGPRFGHPVQRDMGFSNAFVFDILDGDFNFAMDIAESFFNLYPFNRALLLHGECSAPGVKPCLETGITLSDGVSAIVVGPDRNRDEMGATYVDMGQEFRPLSMHRLEPNELLKGTEVAQLCFCAPPPLLLRVKQAGREALNREGSRIDLSRNIHFAVENWFEGCDPSDDPEATLVEQQRPKPEAGLTGPHTLALVMSELLREKCKDGDPEYILALTFNPFKMRLGCRAVRLRSML